MLNASQKIFDEAIVLVVRNNELASSELNTRLTEAGLKPIFVTRGEKGLTVLRHARESGTPLGLVICDYSLPDMSGYDFARLLRSVPSTAETKMVLLTTDHPMGHLPTFAPLGVSHIVQWPGRAENLTGAIAEYIPLRRNVPAANASPEKVAVSTASSDQLRILAADDNAINLAVLRGFLNLAGYSPDTVKDGAEAVTAFKNLHYDLILMDISMPVMDGVAATLQIREIEKRVGKPPIPIVAVTAHYTPGQKSQYIEAGMNDVIAKPINQNVIKECLETWCPRFSQVDPVNHRIAV